MKIILSIIFLLFALVYKPSAQSTIDPSSITLGIDKINMVDGDTIFHWGKTRNAFRGGTFSAADIINDNIGMHSFAYGVGNRAIGDLSFALGNQNRVKESGSYALGKDNVIANPGGFALGVSNEINETQSIAIGDHLITNSAYTIALGRYNVDYQDSNTAENKPIFFLGNGDGRTVGMIRSNAITVLADGRMSLRTATPESDFHLVHHNSSNYGGFRIENEEGGNYWRFYTRSLSNELALYNNAFMGDTIAVGEFNISGSYMGPSDRRLKKNIEDLPYGLKEVLKLAPKRYQFRHVEDRKDIGLIAQEVIDIVPELVSYKAEDDSYKMNYDGYGVLAIKAIQELHDKVVEAFEKADGRYNLNMAEAENWGTGEKARKKSSPTKTS